MNKKDNFGKAVKDLFGTEDKATPTTPVTVNVQAPTNTPIEAIPGVKEPVGKPPMETTTIAKGTEITGNVNVSGNLDIFGNVCGNLHAQGDINLYGKINGNIKSNNITLTSCAVKGDVVAHGKLHVDTQTVVIGNLNAEEIVLSGKIKGDIVCKNDVQLLKGALVVGNITSGGISLEKGAHINGQIISTNDVIDPEKPFQNLF